MTRNDYPIQPVPFTAVQITGRFWAPRIETNRRVTIPYAFKKCEETGRIANFARAAGRMPGEHEGLRYNDSDVFKVIEATAYSLHLCPDAELEAYLDRLIDLIAAAQEEDGYLYTARTINPDRVPERAGQTRWSYLALSHELYNVGHLYEAAVAHYQATGDRRLFDVALKNANLIASVFGPGKTCDIPGHQEIEIGLVKLYRVTGDERFLRLAKFFLDERGHVQKRKLYYTDYGDPQYLQDHKPVIAQDEAVGHAVRAGYMYAAMADVAALTGDRDYLQAISRIWENVVGKKLYLTGGIGARHDGEAFGVDYELPNTTAYAETCAAIANIFWNQRMFLLIGDGQHIDVLERILYNGFLSGISLSGDTFFYANPLASDGQFKFNIEVAATRSPWFECSCCPPNIARFLASLTGYVYATREDNIYVNLFVTGSANIRLDNQTVRVTQATDYPWDGTIRMTVNPENAGEFALRVRVPGWAQSRPVPGDLYQYLGQADDLVTLKVNGEAIVPYIEQGYAVIRRVWMPGDRFEVALPLPVRRVIAHEKVIANVGRVALERGPIVYCAEGIDNGGQVGNLVLPDSAPLRAEHEPELLNGVTTIRGEALDKSSGSAREFVAIPYYAWSHRGEGEMAVWLPRQ